jgi:uncharacterized repeat protein (TIGR03803 family)
MPRAGLVQGRDGNFYGTTFLGGAFDAGTIFKITAAGALTTIHQFAPPDAGLPSAALILARNGKFYGTTIRGGPCDCGTLFEMDTLGTVRTLHTFNGADGARPFGRLFEARDGTFIGTTFGGGAFDAGTIYRTDVTGRVTTIHSFSAADGTGVGVGVIEASDGSLYGTSDQNDFSTGPGSVFRIDPAGRFQTIHRFDGTDGFSPRARLLQASDGRLYGTTVLGGIGFGTIFTITPQGAVTTIHNFGRDDGGFSAGGLIEGIDGDLYGATTSGGSHRAGVVYRVTVIAQRQTAVSDAYVQGGAFASTNFGTASTLLVKKGVSGENTRRSYLRFDIRSIAPSARVRLRLRGRLESAVTPSVTTTVYAVNDTAWGERTITWNTRPDLDMVLGTFAVVGTTARAIEIDITNFVRARQAAGADAITVALRSLVHTSAPAIFNAREAVSGQPQLVIRR